MKVSVCTAGAFGVLLVGVSISNANELPTGATGLGSSDGKGALLVRTETNDPTNRIEKSWLIVESDCPLASKTKRRIVLTSTSLTDLDNKRECSVTRSWLCMRFTPKAARDAKLSASGELGKVEFIAGLSFLIIKNTVAFPTRRPRGKLPFVAVKVEAAWRGRFTKGFSFVGSGWTTRTKPREMCLPNGTEHFFKTYDPALNRSRSRQRR